ncbi:hypothetical protein A5N82_03885 [Christensenella minuta]|uniref:Adenosylcobinamide-GDP ribazoletransferase n=1 Tax=Christensenella minuta TaxID=626937 RepID=A0A136Q4P2_9FIRM|nr:adenosylcobinamide-GDP ribazoletransferase [Christensenella minuta]AYH40939.1 adenosylcobinamide-GDP ribazoletransferase [Christensenella minuta]KXK65643.1 cobalamin-5-phosphate synthase [Christensenella minuta]MDY3750935.1 adenosylcobinamide-GDP ribazoletransferase [Christensenella minuta]OAQ42517.1 hypothetical protein A5N82_03885 [Christensenella minuta]
MKSALGGLATAFSMYSILPMPQLGWSPSTMKYAMCFFPLVGVLCGMAAWLWIWLCGAAGFGPVLFAAVLTLLPVILSGGIHLDGLIDTGDALGSHQSPQRRLDILKDPHVGAFGIIFCAACLLLTFGFAVQFSANPSAPLVLCLGYVLARGYASFAIVSLRLARSTGLAHAFADGADRKAVRAVSVVWTAAASAAMILAAPLAGTAAASAAFLWFLIFRHICYGKFGGLTGDLAGFLLCVTELIVLACAAVAG